jgi:4-diphosphocytidyl-2-C-methyl-D-erythritol kinase
MSETPFTLPSFAKINLHLQVLGKRDDGYHDLCTILQTVSLHDDLSFSPADEIVFACSDDGIPTDDRNLVVRAAKLFMQEFGVTSGAAIHLEKRIPAPGGLGGGSSNAAVTLIGLAKLWEIELNTDELHGMAAKLGADVPYFLYGGTALGTGRGTKIEQVADHDERFVLIVAPDVQISTAEAFSGLNAPNLTKEASKRILHNCRLRAESEDFDHAALRNDFETSVFAAHPEVGIVKQTLLDLGAKHAMMSGSGASVFSIFDKEETRQTALKALENRLNWRKFAVATISRSEYREALEIVY